MPTALEQLRRMSIPSEHRTENIFRRAPMSRAHSRSGSASPSAPAPMSRARGVQRLMARFRYHSYGGQGYNSPAKRQAASQIALAATGIVPVSGAALASEAPTLWGSTLRGFGKLKNLALENVFPKFSGMKGYLAAAGTVLGIETAFKGAKQIAAGQPFNPFPSYNEAAFAAVAPLSRTGAVAGAVAGGGLAMFNKVTGAVNLPNNRSVVPNETWTDFAKVVHDRFNDIAESMGDFNIPAMPQPANVFVEGAPITLPSSNVSVGGGMGAGEMLALLAALGIGGVAGAAIAKKYKRRKRNKKHGRRRKR